MVMEKCIACKITSFSQDLYIFSDRGIDHHITEFIMISGGTGIAPMYQVIFKMFVINFIFQGNQKNFR